MDADVAVNQQRMADAGMTSEPALLVPGGPVAEARAAQNELEETAAQGPAEVLAQQEATLNRSRGDMVQLQEAALEALRSSRSHTTTQGRARQERMVGSEVQLREQASTRANGIFTDAQRAVEELLQPLTDTAMSRWEAGIQRLSSSFRSDLREVERSLEERHSGVGGAIVSLWDDVTGMPDWVVEAYNRAERTFGDGACELARDIAREVNGVIATCEALIEQAHRDIANVFAQLPASLQEWAAGEQARLDQGLDGLRDSARQQRDRFNQLLVQQATQAVQEVQREIQGLRGRARGLVGRIVDAVNAFLEDPARVILEGLLSRLGIAPSAFWAVVARIRDVISDIGKDPLGFAGHLLRAVGEGFRLFFDNVEGHLLRGLLDWLFSGLAGVGVQLPRDMSLGSIVTFFLQLMGITWERIRRLIARRLGERNVELLEHAWTLISTLMEQGPAGIYEMLKDRFNPRELLDQVLTAARDAIVEAVITRVTARILMMFNPVGAILQALEAIYRVLKWIFENASRLFTLVETVVNGMADILSGNTAGLARAIEQGLARLVAPVIDFLAGYAGVGDLPEQIRGVIERGQNWMEGILDRVIGWLADRAQALMRAMGLGGPAGTPPAEGGDTELGETVTFRAGGESHRMWVDVRGEEAPLMIASTPMTLEQRLEDWNSRLESLDDRTPVKPHGLPLRRRAASLMTQAGMILRQASTAARGLARQRRDMARNPGQAPARPVDDNALEAQERQLSISVQELFTLFGDKPEEGSLTVRFRQQLEQLHPSASVQVHDALQALSSASPSSDEGSARAASFASWEDMKTALGSHDKVKHALTTPLTRDHDFGKYADERQAIPQLSAAIRDAEPRATYPGVVTAEGHEEDWLPPRKVNLNRANAPYTEAKRKLNEELFDKSVEPRTNDALKAAFLEAFKEAPPPVSQDLKDAFPSSSTTVVNLLAIIRGKKVGNVDLRRLNDLWTEQGTAPSNRAFLAGRLRGAVKNQHEWIPVSRLIDMVNRDAQESTVDPMANPCQWIKLQHHLRIDTSWVIFKPGKVQREARYEADNQTYAVLQGHPGAIRLAVAGAKAWEQDGEGTFHHELFEVVKEAMRSKATIEQLIAQLRAKCMEWVWNGELPARDLHPRLINSGGVLLTKNMGTVISQQRARLTQMEAAFGAALTAVAKMAL
ncbi:hypothetical protein D7W81_11080 [Corallococcus aberystwythensis]|uniref:Uncharacterized protein n=1 Tax=Corallococcus aberystwythensis TaxID=2316722 RepID=A0A3A8QKV5_9BACT|nr:hypothetical protein D7W81_11080 [Corallococcus aberystwythensis]